jgi:purine-binding chemotaxis protein CheW
VRGQVELPRLTDFLDSDVKTHRALTERELQLVGFSIGDDLFGVDILKVQEINRLVEITRMPDTPTFVDGIINLRGKIIPVIDLRDRLGMVRTEHTRNTRIAVVEICQKIVGFVVDAVSEVLRLPSSVLGPPPSIIAGIQKDYITGVGKLEDRLLILLDLERILAIEEQQQLQNAVI